MFDASSVFFLSGLHLNSIEGPVGIGKQGHNPPAEEREERGFIGLWKSVKEYLNNCKCVVNSVVEQTGRS